VRGDRDRLLDIQEAVEKIEQHVAGRSKQDLGLDELLQVWVVHHLQIIGEAAHGLSEEFLARHREVAWTAMIGMRHVLVHDYFEIDLDIVWATVMDDLPLVKRAVQAICDPTPCDRLGASPAITSYPRRIASWSQTLRPRLIGNEPPFHLGVLERGQAVDFGILPVVRAA